MKKVYLVTSGQYSDFGVDSVHSTYAKAEEWMKQNKPDGSVCEWEVNPTCEHPKGWRKWVVTMRVDGYVERADDKDELGSDTFWRNWSMGGEDCLFFVVGGVNYNEKKVIKIANERRIQLLATINDWANLEEGVINWEELGLIDPNKEGEQ